MALSKITTASLADDSVDTAQIADDAIDTAQIADDAIESAQLANNVAISTSGAITTTGAFTSKGIDDNADATAITITSDEAVGIGKSLTPNNYSGYQSLTIGGSDATTGSVLDFEDSDGNIEGEISATAGRLYLDADPSSATASGFIHLGVDGNQVLKLDDSRNVTIANGNLVIGTAGKGIDFSATGDGASVSNLSELLDEYEEGTFSVGEQNSSLGMTLNFAEYTRIGRAIHFIVHVTFGSGTDSSPVQLTGMPFDGNNGKIQTVSVFTNYTGGTIIPIVQGSTIFMQKNNATVDLTYTDVSGKFVRMSGTYQEL